MQAQQGRFTLMADTFSPMEEQDSRAGLLLNVEIADQVRADARAFLALSGCRPAALFPDLTGLVRDLDEEHRFMVKTAKEHA